MVKKILITGAGSGFGEGTAIGLAQKGHKVIAGVHIWPQATKLREKVKALKLESLRVEKLDILDPYDVQNALNWDIDILVNNAAISFCGPISEIPIDLIKRTFNTNVFAHLELSQRFIRKFIDKKQKAKIVFTSSIAGLYSSPELGAYCASKHALEAVAETLQMELEPFGIQIQTINPGPFRTGFNDTMAETPKYWMDDKKDFNKKADVEKILEKTFAHQYDPQIMIDEMIRIIPADSGKFRNVWPKESEEYIKELQVKAWERKI